MDVLDIWNDLGYIEGFLFSLWIGLMYWGKCFTMVFLYCNNVKNPLSLKVHND